MLDRIHKVAEIIAAFAIVGSLVFVGIQLRQNTSAVRIAAAQAMVSSWGQSNRDLYSNDKMLSLFSRMFAGQSVSLDGEDGMRVRLWIENGIRQVEFNYYNWVNGDLDRRFWDETQAGAVSVLSMEAGRYVWSVIRLNHGIEFRTMMDRLIVEAEES